MKFFAAAYCGAVFGAVVEMHVRRAIESLRDPWHPRGRNLRERVAANSRRFKGVPWWEF